MSRACVAGGRKTAEPLGFTLTELLVVIGILILLTMTAVPAIQAFRRGQRLDQSARLIQAALADARRLAVTKHARHVVVLYSYQDTASEKEGTVESVRHALRVYCEPVGDPSWTKGYFPGGYVGTPVILPAGIRFSQERMSFAQIYGPVADPSKPLPVEHDYFKKAQQSRAIAFRRDGTFDYDSTLDEPAVNPLAGRNIYQADEGIYQVPEGCKADVVLVEVTQAGVTTSEVRVKGKARRGLVDLQPATGRATPIVVDVGSGFLPPPGGL